MRHVQCLFGLKRLIQIVSLASQGAEGASMHTLRCHRLSTGSVAPVIEAALQWRNPVTSDTLPAGARRLADAFGFDRNGHGCPPVRRVSGLGSLICRRQTM